jgi:hypothetical protein
VRAHQLGADWHALFGEDGGALHHILQFTHIAGPVVRDRSRHAAFGEPPAFEAMFLGEAFKKVVRQDFDIPGAVAQGRHLDREDIEAIVKILAELALLDRLQQVAVRGGQNAHIHLDRFVAADALEFPLLKNAEELGLEGQRNLADLVEEDRAAIGQSKRPSRWSVAPVKEPLSWPKKFALDQRLGDRRAYSPLMNGLFARWLLRKISLATNSLPVPFSPLIITVAFVRPTR